MIPLASFGLASLVVARQASSSVRPPIQPDRPDFTNGVGIVPQGTIQFELGYRQVQQGTATLFDYGDQGVIRIATSERFELRIGVPSYLGSIQAGPSRVGFGDPNVGFKWRLSDAKGSRTPALGLQINATLPSGTVSAHQSSQQTALTGILSFDFGQDSLDMNAVVNFPYDSGFYTQYAASASYGHPWSSTLSSFFELYALFPGGKGGGNQAFADLGLAQRLGNDVSIDLFYGNGLNGNGRSRFFGGGVSFRF